MVMNVLGSAAVEYWMLVRVMFSRPLSFQNE